MSDPSYLSHHAIKVDPSLGILGVLLEPMTVIIKALEQVLAVGQRAFWEPKTVLVTGAGPIGLLAAAVTSLGGLRFYDRRVCLRPERLD